RVISAGASSRTGSCNRYQIPVTLSFTPVCGRRPGCRRSDKGGHVAVATGDGATIRDVAARAGVSIATVSRVLRGNVPVTPATRARVVEAIKELGFRPSVLGRSLAEGRHAANGIVFPDLSGPYFAEVVLGYEE